MLVFMEGFEFILTVSISGSQRELYSEHSVQVFTCTVLYFICYEVKLHRDTKYWKFYGLSGEYLQSVCISPAQAVVTQVKTE